MPTFHTTSPTLLGPLAIYAPDLKKSRQVYAAVAAETQLRNFGTVTLDNGEEIDWIDMTGSFALSCEEQ